MHIYKHMKVSTKHKNFVSLTKVHQEVCKQGKQSPGDIMQLFLSNPSSLSWHDS
jgi:hypothetical protein